MNSCQQLTQRGQMPPNHFFHSNLPPRGSYMSGKTLGLRNKHIREIPVSDPVVYRALCLSSAEQECKSHSSY